jgi:16S rRNA (guanine(966)-N(2))-methyltransferase RsmD
MNLRITAGFLKGRVLRLPDEAIGCRPTLERARISIADMIWPLITGAVCADLCAGSGAFGFEMISRGAARVDFVEKDRRYADGIRMHAAKFGVEDRCRIFGQEVRLFLGSVKGPYRVVFYDPPYDDPELKGMVVPLLSLLDAEGKLLYQRHRERGKRTTEAAEDVPRPVDVRLYGDTVVESYTPVPAQP